MSDKTLLSIDQGTTSSRAILFSQDGEIISVQQKELTLHYPNNGWVEQDANDIWNDTLAVTKDVIDGQGDAAKNIAAIGITNQRETTIVWDKATGDPVYNAIVWQDRRTSEYCRQLKADGHETVISEKTGLLLDPYFSATKIAWILDNVDGARQKAENGDLIFGTVDCYLLWKLTNGTVHATDATNASRTMLYNIQQGCWDDALLELFNIPKSMMPDVCDNAHDFGSTDMQHFGVSIPICGMAGDQQAALIGQGCFDVGMVKSTYGTGCFALMNIGKTFQVSDNRLLTTIGYQLDGTVNYAVEGSIFVAGAAIQFLRDNLEFFSDAAKSEGLADSVDDTNGVYFIPAFTGLGAPHWNPEARGIISGLTRGTQKAHITRAALEAQGYQTHDLMHAMQDDSGKDVHMLRIDGGLAANDFVCQFLADILNVQIEIPKVIETTAWGAACLAGLKCGIFNDLENLEQSWAAHKTFKPNMSSEKRTALIQGWTNSIQMLNG